MIKEKNIDIKILCTLGPSSFNEFAIKRLEELGVSLFRINLSHTSLEDLDETIDFIMSISKIPICIDTEGAQIRTGKMKDNEAVFENDSIIYIHKRNILGDNKNLFLYPPIVFNKIIAGDLLWLDFKSVLIKIIEKEDDIIKAKVLNGGIVGSNKAANLNREINLSSLTDKDIECIDIAKKRGIKNYSLSFANYKKDVEQMRKLIGQDSIIISKIESKKGIMNIEEILSLSDAILIDRGDMGRELPIESIPYIQKSLIKKSKQRKVPVYVATNLLESMTTQIEPTRAEVNDVINTLQDGANGLVLAAETAIGSYPIVCTQMIVKLINEFKKNEYENGNFLNYVINQEYYLIKPHGGTLITTAIKQYDESEIDEYKKIYVNDEILINSANIINGVFSPLDGFMDRDNLNNVLDNNKLSSGILWTIPVIIQTFIDNSNDLKIDETVALVRKSDQKVYALLKIYDIYKFNFESICKRWFGTLDRRHSGVFKLMSEGDVILGGKIEMIREFPYLSTEFGLTPHQTRSIFKSRGWKKIIGIDIHDLEINKNENNQKNVIAKSYFDGLLINHIININTNITYDQQDNIKYRLNKIKENYPENKAVLISSFEKSHHFNYRKIIHEGICKKNYGCSHFESRNQEIVKKFDIGIIPKEYYAK